MDTYMFILIMMGSFVITTQSYRVLVMERKFQEIVKEFRQEHSVINEQDNEKKRSSDIIEKQSGFNQKERRKTIIDLMKIFVISNNINEKDKTKEQNGTKEPRDSGIMSKDSGHAINCGPPGTKMNFTWEPKTIGPRDNVAMTLDMIAPVDFENGKVNADVYAAGMTTPIFHYTKKVTCSILELIITGVCPKGKISKNDHIQASAVYKSKQDLPVGTFTVVANITNERNELFQCANVTFTVSNGNNDCSGVACI